MVSRHRDELIAIASGGYYLFHSENTKKARISAEIAAKAPKTDTSGSNGSSNQQAGSSPGGNASFIPAEYIEAAFTYDDDAVTDKTDDLFSNPTTPDTKINIKTDPEVQARIDALRAEITTTLNDWKALIQEVNADGTSQESDNEVRQYADDVQQYIYELQAIVDGLTPDNSGLTPEEIAADQAAVNPAIQEADQAETIIDTPPSGTNDNYSPPVDQGGSSPDQSGAANGQDNSSGQSDPDSGSSGSSGDQSGSSSSL